MRFLRFLYKELLLNGILFSILGTVVLSSLYLISLGVSPAAFVEAFRSFFLGLIGHADYSTIRAGFSSGQIILAGAVLTLPLTLICVIYILIFSLLCSSMSVAGKYLNMYFKSSKLKLASEAIDIVLSILATVPLFVSFWVLRVMGENVPLVVIGLVAVLMGGLAWDAVSFLKNDMILQVEQTHAIVFSTQGKKLGRFFPIPGSYTWFLFVSSLPRFIPYMAGKVPAIIGAVTIAEIAFDFPGLGKNLIDALIASNTNLLITSVFILLCVNAFVSLIVKTVLFLVFPRWYEKNI